MRRDIIGVILVMILAMGGVFALGWMAFQAMRPCAPIAAAGKADLLLAPDHLREGGQ